MLNKRDTAAVLYALRSLQESMVMDRDDMAAIMAEHGLFDGIQPPTADEIDALCQSLNFGDPLVIAVEGGMVQSINHPWACADVVVIDYDTDCAGEDEVASVPQPDGGQARAFVNIHEIAPPDPAIYEFAAQHVLKCTYTAA